MLQHAITFNNDDKIQRYNLWIDLLTKYKNVSISKRINHEIKQFKRKEKRKNT